MKPIEWGPSVMRAVLTIACLIWFYRSGWHSLGLWLACLLAVLEAGWYLLMVYWRKRARAFVELVASFEREPSRASRRQVARSIARELVR